MFDPSCLRPYFTAHTRFIAEDPPRISLSSISDIDSHAIILPNSYSVIRRCFCPLYGPFGSMKSRAVLHILALTTSCLSLCWQTVRLRGPCCFRKFSFYLRSSMRLLIDFRRQMTKIQSLLFYYYSQITLSSAIPFGVFQMHLCSLDDLSFNRLLEEQFDLSTFAESSFDAANQFTFVDAHFFPHEVLQICFFIKQVLDDDRVSIDDSIHCTFLRLLFKQLYGFLVVLFIDQHLDRAMEGYPTGLLIVIDIGLVSDHFESQVRIEISFKGYNRKEFCLLILFGLPKHLLIYFSNCHVGLLGIQQLILRVEQSKLSFDCLMSRHDVEAGLRLDGALIEPNQVQVNYTLAGSPHVARSTPNATFNEVGLEVVHEHGDPVSLFRDLHWFTEHLHRFNLAFLLNFAQLNLLTGFDTSLNYSSCDDGALPFNFEAMIDQVEKLLICLPFWNRYLSQKHIFQLLIMVLRLLLGRERHHYYILSKFSLAEDLTQSSHLCLQYFFIFDQIDLVQNNNHFFHKEFGDNDAFGCLSLNSFGNIDDEEHDVDNLSSANDSLDERGMAGAVDECKLQVFFFDVLIESGWYSGKEGRETKVKSNPPFLRLWIFIETGSGGDFAEDSADGSLTRVHMAKHPHIYINAFVGLNCAHFFLAQIQKVFLHINYKTLDQVQISY